MSNGTIVTLKKNTTHDAEPSASSLYQAELAINTADAKIFAKRDDGTVLSQSIGTVQSNYQSLATAGAWNIDYIDGTIYRSAKYVIQCTHGNDFQTIEILLMHDGTDVYITRYGLMYTNGELATFTADMDGDGVFLDTVTIHDDTMIKFTRTVVLA